MAANIMQGYEWLCVKDPSGLFFQRLFTKTDIQTTARRPCLWPEGITWQNIKNQERLSIQNGYLQHLGA